MTRDLDEIASNLIFFRAIILPHRIMAEALQKLVLNILNETGTIQDTRTLVIPGEREPATSHEAQITILGALNSLLSREVCPSLLSVRLHQQIRLLIMQMISYDAHETSSHILTPEGAQIILEGSHEARVWAALPAKGEGDPVGGRELKQKVGDEAAKIGQGRAFKNNWIAKEGSGFVKVVSHAVISDISSANSPI